MRYGFVLIWGALLMAGCNLQTDYFKDYAGVNLISNRVFDTNVATNTWLIPSAITASEVSFTSLGTTLGREAWRLQIPNALADGDFEAGGTGGFSAANGTVTNVTTSPQLLDGTRSLSLVSTNFGVFQKNLSTLATGTYQVQFDYRTPVAFTFTTTTSGASQTSEFAWTTTFEQTSNNTQVNDSTLVHRATLSTMGFQPLSVINGTNYFLEWSGTSGQWSGVVDNLSAVRTDLPLAVESTLVELTSTTAKLLPGIYEFSVYVLDDPTAGTGNVFHPRSVTLAATVITTEGSQNYTSTIARPLLGWPTWTKVTLRMTDVNIPDVLPPASPYAAKLSISPTGYQAKDKWAGSVLVADPRLEFFER